MPKINILHFSDFHLDKHYEKEAEQILSNMITSVKSARLAIDLVIFSGDMINQGGESYGSIDEAFQKFKQLVIDKLLLELNLTPERFIFALGNHDSDVSKRNIRGDETDDKELTTEAKIKQFIVSNANDPYYLDRQKAVIKFRDNYYKAAFHNGNYFHTLFQANFKIDIKGVKVGITSLNTSWRCAKDDKDRLVLGVFQILDSENILKDCGLKIAVGHHHPIAMKEFERHHISNILSKDYDIYFCGHTHSSYVELRNSEGWLMDITAAGTLSSNQFNNDIDYTDGFQIVECDTDKHDFIIHTYLLQDYSYFKELKTRTDHVPQPEDDPKKLEETFARAKSAEEKLQSLQSEYVISPFITIERFKHEYNFLQSYNFITNEKINAIIEQFRNLQDRGIRFLALSGMGKTRIVYEAFKDVNDSNILYTSEDVSENLMMKILSSHEDQKGLFILDNCTLDNLFLVENCIRKKNSDFKIISIYNDLAEKDDQSGLNVIRLGYEDVGDIVDKYLSEEKFLCSIKNKDEIVNLIKKYSGNIPYMAFLLTDAYREIGAVKLKDANYILNRLLGNPTDNQLKVLESIAIFKLLGCAGPYKDELDVVKNNVYIHHLTDLDDSKIDYLYNHTIDEFNQKQIIERLTYWINVRPQPLAEWLVSKWFDDADSDSLSKMFNKIKVDSCRKRMLSSFCKRIDDMGQTSREKDIVKSALSEYGPFCSESVAVSSEGSRLMLSMANVNPKAVADCLYFIFNGKDTEYLRENIKDDTRWNLNRALQKCCVMEDSFEKAAIILGRFAISDNEIYSNGAKGTFMHLFHIYLSATQSSPKQRIRILQYLSGQGKEFHKLIIDAISSAFTTNNLVIDGQANVVGNTEYKEYRFDKYSDIQEYWHQCINVLKKILEETPSLSNYAEDKLSSIVSDFVYMHAVAQLIELLSILAPKVEYKWIKMRDNIHYVLSSKRLQINQEDRDILKDWEDKLTPKDYLSRVHDTLKFKNDEMLQVPVERSFQFLYDLILPLAEEFVVQELYSTEVLHQVLSDREHISTMFYKAIAECILKYNKQDKFVNCLLSFIESQTSNYNSPILLNICGFARNQSWVKELRDTLYSKHFFYLAVSLIGITSDENITGLDVVLSDVDAGKYSCGLINSFLQYFGYNTANNMSRILDMLNNHSSVDKYKVTYPYIMNYSLFIGRDDGDEYKMLTKKMVNLLLDYDFTHGNYQEVVSVVRRLDEYVKQVDDTDLAIKYNRKIISTLNANNLLSNPFEFSYFNLLPQYQEFVLDDILEALSIEQYDKAGFYNQMRYHLGSGTGSGAGPLFQCNYDKLKAACYKHPHVLPSRLAGMCPVYRWDKSGHIEGLSDFFLWLIETFPSNEDILHSFGANMGTWSWSGTGTMQTFFEKRVSILQDFAMHTSNSNARNWALKTMKRYQENAESEHSKGEWEERFYS